MKQRKTKEVRLERRKLKILRESTHKIGILGRKKTGQELFEEIMDKGFKNERHQYTDLEAKTILKRTRKTPGTQL